jgi:hypothetical protein
VQGATCDTENDLCLNDCIPKTSDSLVGTCADYYTVAAGGLCAYDSDCEGGLFVCSLPLSLSLSPLYLKLNIIFKHSATTVTNQQFTECVKPPPPLPHSTNLATTTPTALLPTENIAVAILSILVLFA